MDWGFAKVEDSLGNVFTCACFAMICHHCVVDMNKGANVQYSSSTNNTGLFYRCGKVTGTSTQTATPIFPAESSSSMAKIGAKGNTGTGGNIRICGVRVYDRALSAAEIEKNNAYDRWYYFGDTVPTDAGTLAAPLSWGTTADLFRSNEGNYNGVLAQSNYTGNGSELPRGYWYLRSGSDGSYAYSPIKVSNGEDSTTGTVYFPRLNTRDLGGEYFDPLRERYVNGQEGETTLGVLYDVQGGELFNGGYRLPLPVGALDRNNMLPATSRG